jgi:hypothetical protein
MQHVPGTGSAYEFSFNGTGTGRYAPQVSVTFADGSTQVHNESFQVETNRPQLAFKQVQLADLDGQQHLILSAEASDDVDISYVSFSATGLRASDLRAAGGVVDRAREKAFAGTDGADRVYPGSEDQALFVLNLPVHEALDADAIAHDGVVLIDIMAVDASGNQSALSRIAFTGDDVVEEASNLQVSPANIIFTNLLETVTLIPSVEYQFRGRTPLPGAGNNIMNLLFLIWLPLHRKG